MQELIFWAAIVILSSAILLMIPFTKDIFRPVYAEIFKGLTFLVKEGMLWIWYFFKLILKSHLDFIDNLRHSRADYDAEEMLKELRAKKRKERRG